MSATSAPLPAPLVLVIEDEAPMHVFLRATLAANGYRVAEVVSGEHAIAFASSRMPDLVLLDLGLPDLDGVDVIRRLRAFCAAPILVLSARDREQDKVEAMDAGADDYLTKPFGVRELLARLRVALRHAAHPPGSKSEPIFSTGNLRVNRESREVWVDGKAVRLTPIEWRLLAVFVAHAGKVVTRQQLLQEVWGPACAGEIHYLRVYVSHLRRKLEADPTRPHRLLTEPGVGYRLKVDD
jgi:two-component system KDP operon response regulator KdpE